MANLTVANGVSYSPGAFFEYVASLDNGDVVKHQDDLWRVSYGTDGEVFVRGNDFNYNGDHELISGDITSFSFNQGGSTPGEYGPALYRIRNLDDVSAADIHNAIETHDNNALNAIYRDAFKHDDVLIGANEQDFLVGYKGDDKIVGNEGNDTLIGGKGQDRLYASGDDDTSDDNASDAFIFANGDSGKNASSADKIFGFVNGEDYIDVSETGAHKKDVHIDHHGGNSYITIDAHDGHDKMMIVVVDNAEVHKDALAYDMMLQS